MTTVQEFIDELSRRLRDVKKKQWDDEFLVSALNSALSALTTTIPKAFTVHRDITLVGGVEQAIDDDLNGVISILHNVSPADGTPRRAVTKADMSVFDASHPHWRQDDVRPYVRHWLTDDYDESKFYVWPPAAPDRGDEPAVPTEPVDPGPVSPAVSQEEVDAYVAALAVYTEARALHDAWEAAPLSHIIRGSFWKTPHVTRSDEAQTTAPEGPPVEPTDPGPVGNGLPQGIDIAEPRLSLIVDTGTSGTGANQFSALRATTPGQSSFDGELLLLDIESLVNHMASEVDASTPYMRTSIVSGNFHVVRAFIDQTLAPANRDSVGNSSHDITLGDFRWMVEQGYKHLPVFANGIGDFRQAHVPVVDVADMFLLTSIPTSNDITEGAGNSDFDDASVIIDGVSEGAMVAGLGATALPDEVSTLDAILALGDAVNVELTMNGTQKIDFMVLRNAAGEQFVWDIDVSPLFYANSSSGENTVLNGNSTYFISRQPTATTRGSMIRADVGFYGDSPDPGAGNPFMWPTEHLREAYTNRTTQAVVDAYLAALVQYRNDLSAYESELQAYTEYLRGDVLTVQSNLPVKRAHMNALQEFAMYYAYSIDDDLTANSGRAQRHWLAFFQILNKRENSDLQIGSVQETVE